MSVLDGLITSEICIILVLFLNCLETNTVWFKHVLFRRKGLGASYNGTMPSLEILFGLNILIDIQTSKTLIQMDINKMMRMEFIQ